MKLLHLLLPAVAAGAQSGWLFSNNTKNGTTPYYHGVGMGVDTTVDPPVRRPPPPLPNRRTEPASDDLWQKCHDKGCTLSWSMQANDADVGRVYSPPRDNARSAFRNQDDLQRWGWSPFPSDKIDDSFDDFHRTWGIGEALAGIGVSEHSDIYEGGKHRVISIDHREYSPSANSVDEQWYDVDNEGYRATGASYAFSIDVKDGVIMGLNRVSPLYAARDRKPPVPNHQLPALKQFSDIAWIGWDSLAEGDETKGLRYLLSVGVVNTETKSVIRRALDARGWELSSWPGHTFERDWPETKALMGTPNLQGFGYLLVEHKDVLGNMFIESVQVFQSDTASRNPSIVMHLSKPLALNQARRRGDGRSIDVQVVKVVELHALRAKL